MRCSGASFCAFPWFALSSALLCTHTPCPLQGPCTSGRAEQHCGTEASQAWRHPPARVSWLPPGMLQIWHPTSWKQKQKCSHCCSQVPWQCSPGWSIADMTHCDPSAASQGILHVGAQVTVNVSTPLLSSPKSHSHQRVWQLPDIPMLCQSISFATFLPQYSGDSVPCSWGYDGVMISEC